MKNLLLLLSAIFLGSCFAVQYNWAAVEIYSSSNCTGDMNYAVYHLNDCYPNEDNATFPYRIVYCNDTEGYSLVCTDSACTQNCVIEDPVYVIGECTVNPTDGTGGIGNCYVDQPADLNTTDPNTLYVKLAEYENQQCTGTPYNIFYLPLPAGCNSGIIYDCNNGVLEAQYCTNSDCTGDCISLGQIFPSCAANATIGNSEGATCYPFAPSPSPNPSSSPGSSSTDGGSDSLGSMVVPSFILVGIILAKLM